MCSVNIDCMVDNSCFHHKISISVNQVKIEGYLNLSSGTSHVTVSTLQTLLVLNSLLAGWRQQMWRVVT